jgi:lipoprotein signal peptidase
VWLLLLYSIKYYYSVLGKSLLIDLSFAFLTTGLLGNLIIDRMMFGYIRDYLILPMGIANIADFCGLISVILFSIEIIISTELRTILLGKYKSQSVLLETNK